MLTDTNSQWRFGFCRHDTKSDNAMLVVTHLPWHEQFVKYINVLAEIRSNSPKDFQRFLSETYALGLPESGSSVKVFSNHDRYVSAVCIVTFLELNYFCFFRNLNSSVHGVINYQVFQKVTTLMSTTISLSPK